MARTRPPSKGSGPGRGRPARIIRKPRDYKAEYARRIKRGLALGRTRQGARGHQPKEHILRKLPPDIRKRVREAMRAGITQELEYRKKRQEIEKSEAIKDLYKRVKNIFTETDTAEAA